MANVQMVTTVWVTEQKNNNQSIYVILWQIKSCFISFLLHLLRVLLARRKLIFSEEGKQIYNKTI